MTRFSLAALAFACAVSPTFAMGHMDLPASYPPSSSYANAAILGSAGAILFMVAALFSKHARATAVMACLSMMLLSGVAFAQAITTTPTVTPAVVIPYGEYVVAVAQMLSDILVPLFVAVVMGLLAKFYPMARMLISEALVERTLRKWFDFGVNATAGAVKDNTVTVPVGAEIVANSLQRAVNRADVNAVSRWTMDQAGGPEEVANKLFRMLKLDRGATASEVVAPALASLPVK